MTITISWQAHWELFQETVEPSQHPDPDDAMDVVYKYPQPLGQGYLRLIDLREGLVLSILNLQLSDRCVCFSGTLHDRNDAILSRCVSSSC